MIKRTFKFTLSALLLAASASAFAEEAQVVTLKGGKTKKTWSEFVYAINNPSSVKGVIPDDDPLKKALDDAEVILGQKNGLLTTAKSNLANYIENNVDPVKKIYDDAEADLVSWNSQLQEWNGQVSQLTGKSQSINTQIEIAKENLEEAQKKLDAVATTTQTTNTSLVDWLDPIYTKAQSYLAAWNLQISGKGTTTVDLYYQIATVDIMPGVITSTTLTIAFEKPAIYDEDNGWKTATTTLQFVQALYSGSNPISFSATSVYLGENLKDVNGKSVNSELSFSAPSNNLQIIQNAFDALKNLTQTSGYYTTTVKTETTYDDPGKTLETARDDAQTALNNLKKDRQGILNQLQAANDSVAKYQGLIDGYTKVPAGSAEGTVSTQTQYYNNWQEKVAGQKPYEEAVTTAQTNVDAAQKDVDDATENLKTAQANADATARDAYKSITLTGEVNATVAIEEEYDGTINGGGNVININITGDHPQLFSVFAGRISNVAINGTFAATLDAKSIQNVATWNGTSSGRFYGEAGTPTPYTKIDALGFAARDFFGVSFSANDNKGALTTLTADSKVYSITKYELGKADVQKFVQVKDGKFVPVSGTFEIADNMFAKSATDDITGVNNVFYTDEEGNNICENVVVVDKKSFYCPVSLTAENVEVKGRTFKSGANSVCLPFELDYELFNGQVGAICKYDRESGNTFYFSKVAESVPANTPVLLYANNDFSMNLTNIEIAATPEGQTKVDQGAEDDPSYTVGLLKNATDEQIAGVSQSYKVYGLSGGKFKWAGANAPAFPAMRMVIVSETAQPTGAMAAPRNIAVMDEMGIDITDQLNNEESGINDLAADDSLIVRGGQGEILFISEADYGKVSVYTVDGKQVAIADVVEGTTAVKLQSGVYVVNGKKVMVK